MVWRWHADAAPSHSVTAGATAPRSCIAIAVVNAVAVVIGAVIVVRQAVNTRRYSIRPRGGPPRQLDHTSSIKSPRACIRRTTCGPSARVARACACAGKAVRFGCDAATAASRQCARSCSCSLGARQNLQDRLLIV